MSKIKSLALVAMLAIVSPAIAGPPHSGNDWMRECSVALKQKTLLQFGHCYGYARGVQDGLDTAAQLTQQSVACPPKEVDAQQLVEVGLRFLRNHPEHRHEWAAYNLTAAFIEAWPCGNSEEQPRTSFK